MMNRKIFASWIIIAVVSALLGAGTVAYFSDTETSSGNTFTAGTLDLKLSDHSSNGPWSDGVTGTWTLSNMMPGDETPTASVYFKNFGSVASSTMEITCNYTVTEETPRAGSDTDPNTDQHPDEMAKHMIITYIHYRDDLIDIDCLTGKNYTQSPIEDWRINDTDGDGIITLYDLKQDPLINLPSPDTQPNKVTQLDMSIKFDENAGNGFQGDTFNLTMIFTLKQ
jgi:predicted ribosomally synthesized peptide with SipW-like signal peptide